MTVIGQPLPRPEGPAKVTGRARYTADHSRGRKCFTRVSSEPPFRRAGYCDRHAGRPARAGCRARAHRCRHAAPRPGTVPADGGLRAADAKRRDPPRGPAHRHRAGRDAGSERSTAHGWSAPMYARAPFQPIDGEAVFPDPKRGDVRSLIRQGRRRRGDPGGAPTLRWRIRPAAAASQRDGALCLPRGLGWRSA